MIEEVFHAVHRYGETQAFAEGDFHVGHANDFTAQVEERTAAVARIDLRRGLQVQLALHRAGLRADDPFGDGPFQSQRTADGEDPFADGQGVRVAEENAGKPWCVFLLNLEQGQVREFVHRDDPNLLVTPALELSALLVINLHGNLRFVLDDMEIRDEETLFADDETGTQAARRADLHDGFAELADQLAHGMLGGRSAGRLEQTGLAFGRRQNGSGGLRNPAFGGLRRHVPGDPGNLASRHDQHGVAQIDNHLVAFLRENLTGDRSPVFQLQNIRRDH